MDVVKITSHTKQGTISLDKELPTGTKLFIGNDIVEVVGGQFQFLGNHIHSINKDYEVNKELVNTEVSYQI